MSRTKRISIFLLFFFAAEAFLGAFGYLTAYLQMNDTVGVLATVSYILQQFLASFPIFFAIGVAFSRARERGVPSALAVLAVLLPFALVYQTALTFLDYYFLQNDLFGTSLLIGLLNGLFAGILTNTVLFALLFLIPYFLFLREKQMENPDGIYAPLSAMLILVLYGLLEETAALLSHLSENFWIVYPSEILSFVLFCLLRVGIAAFGFFIIRLTEKRHLSKKSAAERLP